MQQSQRSAFGRLLTSPISVLIALALPPAPGAAAGCAGADPAITSVVVSGVTPNGKMNEYQITGTVRNLGRKAQPKNTLQFVDIFMAQEKLDAKGIPPLGPGKSYTFDYTYRRSSDAGEGTTRLRFQFDMRQPYSDAAQNCSTGNDLFVLPF